MSFIRALFAGAAAISTGSVPGKIVHDASQPDFSITSCNEHSVVIQGNEANTLATGDILAFVSNDASVCTNCSPLFRKIISHSDNTFETTFATFDEVFPEEAFDATLASVEIESLLGCSHSGSKHRLLQSPNATDIVEACGRNVVTSTMVMLIATVLSLSLILIPCALVGYWISWSFCPELWKDTVFGAGSILIPNLSRRSLEERQAIVVEEIDFSLGSFEMDFPSTSNDWMAKDSEGNCLHVDCHENSSACFEPQRFCAKGCEASSGLLGLSVNPNNDIDFTESCCIHDYCYASKFEKATCDSNFHKSMLTSCVALDTTVATTFPLDISTLNSNCNMLSFLLFLGVRVFGRNAYENSQIQQNAYNEVFCNNDLLQI